MIHTDLLGPHYRFAVDYLPYPLSDTQKDARRSFLETLHRQDCVELRTNCPYCNAAAYTVVSQVDARGLPAQIALCDSCGGCFKADVLTEEATQRHYAQFSYALRGKDLSPTARQELFGKRVKEFAFPRYRFLRKLIPELAPGSSVIEIGCGDGANLVPWKENGFEVKGIEFDAEAVRFGCAQGLDLVTGDFLRLDFSYAKPKLIVASHLIEHLRDIPTFLRWVRAQLAEDGFLFVETPGMRGQGLGKPLRYFDVEHNFYFDCASILRVFRQCGFGARYADEFIRLIAPAAVAERHRDRGSPGAYAALLCLLARAAGIERLCLKDLMRESDRGSLRMRLMRRLQTEYLRAHYERLEK